MTTRPLSGRTKKQWDRLRVSFISEVIHDWVISYYGTPIGTQEHKHLTLYGHIKTAVQQTIIQQFGSRFVHWPVMSGLLHLVQREVDFAGPQPAQAPSLLVVPNVIAHPSTASVPTSMWYCNCVCRSKRLRLVHLLSERRASGVCVAV